MGWSRFRACGYGFLFDSSVGHHLPMHPLRPYISQVLFPIMPTLSQKTVYKVTSAKRQLHRNCLPPPPAAQKRAELEASVQFRSRGNVVPTPAHSTALEAIARLRKSCSRRVQYVVRFSTWLSSQRSGHRLSTVTLNAPILSAVGIHRRCTGRLYSLKNRSSGGWYT